MAHKTTAHDGPYDQISAWRHPTDAWEVALLFQQGITAAASGFNACHFAAYRSPLRRRRWGALALALANLALFAESLYLGMLPSCLGESVLLSARARFAVGWLALAASATMALFVLKRARRR